MRTALLAIVASLLAWACGPTYTPFKSVPSGSNCEQAIDCGSGLCELNVCVEACSDGSAGTRTSDAYFDVRNGCATSN